LYDDHVNAQRLAEGLANIPGFDVDLATVQTNMVFFSLADSLADKFRPFMADKGIIVSDRPSPIRVVTHYGIDAADIENVLRVAAECSAQYFI
jgi:threonine aldolase